MGGLPKAKFSDSWHVHASRNRSLAESSGWALWRRFGFLVLALFALLWLGGFVVFLDFTDFGEPVVFAIDGTHIADECVEIEILDVIVFVCHVKNIYFFSEFKEMPDQVGHDN